MSKWDFTLADNVELKDQAKNEIVTKDYHLLIGENHIFNQAGIELNIEKGETDAATIKNINERLNKGSTSTFTESDLIKATSFTAWFNSDNKEYFITENNGHVSVFQLSKNHSPTLRIPESRNKLANKYLAQGYAPVPHFMRQGSKTVSWYRGPLSTIDRSGANAENNSLLNVVVADELVRYLTDTGMFDISYAAAWELGRLLALQNKQFSTDLHRWKRRNARSVTYAEHVAMHHYLPHTTSANKRNEGLPDKLKTWFDKLWNLEAIPFNYLVPDERMLPSESIRFFYLEQHWMECLVHGAFSIGNGTGKNLHANQDNGKSPTASHNGVITGFLLKSEVVAGWPDMMVDGWPGITNETEDENKPKLKMTKRQIAPNILLCLFEGDVMQVDFHLKPEAFHFGFHQEKDNGPFLKNPRNAEGKESEDQINVQLEENRKVKIAKLYEQIAGKKDFLKFKGDEIFSPAHFALSMVEGTDRVRFIKSQTK